MANTNYVIRYKEKKIQDVYTVSQGTDSNVCSSFTTLPAIWKTFLEVNLAIFAFVSSLVSVLFLEDMQHQSGLQVHWWTPPPEWWPSSPWFGTQLRALWVCAWQWAHEKQSIRSAAVMTVNSLSALFSCPVAHIHTLILYCTLDEHLLFMRAELGELKGLE